MQNQKGNIALIIVGIVAVAILAGGVGYFVAKKPAQKEEQKQEKQVEQPEIVDETADASAIALATADWKTYRNEKYGFEVKYPMSWFFIDCDSSYTGFSYSQSKLPSCFTNQKQPHINIKVTEGSTVGIEKYIEDAQNFIDNYSKATITINGNISATKLTGLVKPQEGPGQAGGLQTIVVLFSRNNNIYQVYYYGLDNKDYSQIFDQIISTFKFIK